MKVSKMVLMRIYFGSLDKPVTNPELIALRRADAKFYDQCVLCALRYFQVLVGPNTTIQVA